MGQASEWSPTLAIWGAGGGPLKQTAVRLWNGGIKLFSS